METWNHITGHMAMNWCEREEAACDVLVLGGGLAGCYAAIAAARRGAVYYSGGKGKYRAQWFSPRTGVLTIGSQHVPIPALR